MNAAEVNRLMPPKIDLGKSCMSTMALPMTQWADWKKDPAAVNPHGLRTIMGFCLPTWQRGLVWTEAQNVSFIESAWLGIPIGTFSYNQAKIGSPLDYLLIDGQQRMNAIERYVTDQFKVFGYLYSELPKPDERRWVFSTSFPSFICETEDEGYLRNYYDLMNFGGVAHEQSQRAVKSA